MADYFDTLVELLNSEPTQQCVIRTLYLEDLNIEPDVLAKAANRPWRSALNFTELPERGMALRDKVYVFGLKEA